MLGLPLLYYWSVEVHSVVCSQDYSQIAHCVARRSFPSDPMTGCNESCHVDLLALHPKQHENWRYAHRY